MSTTSSTPPVPSTAQSGFYLNMTMLVLFSSMHYIFSRWFADMLPPLTANFWMFSVATSVLLIYNGVKGTLRWQVFFDHIYFFVVVGFLVAGATWLSYTGTRYIDAGTAGLLSLMATVFAILFGVLWLGDRMTVWQWVGAGVATVGAIVIRFQPVDALRFGALIVICGSFFYAGHAAVVKKYGDGIDFNNFFLFRVMSTWFGLAVFLLISGQPLWVTAPPTRTLGYVWFAIVLTAMIDIVFSRIYYYLALRQIPISYHSIILMLSPVVTILWSLLFFAERPTMQGLVGGVVVIAGVAIVSMFQIRE